MGWDCIGHSALPGLDCVHTSTRQHHRRYRVNYRYSSEEPWTGWSRPSIARFRPAESRCAEPASARCGCAEHCTAPPPHRLADSVGGGVCCTHSVIAASFRATAGCRARCAEPPRVRRRSGPVDRSRVRRRSRPNSPHCTALHSLAFARALLTDALWHRLSTCTRSL